MKNTLLRNNRKSAPSRWEDTSLLQTLKAHTERFKFSISNGDLLLLDRRWYVTHTGMVGLANLRHCHGIDVQPSVEFSHPSSSRWAFKATVFKSSRCRGFVGYGDADPSNVSPLVHGAEMRVAETRVVNRALRKAYGIASARSRKSTPMPNQFPPPRVEEAPAPTGQWQERKLRRPQSPRPPLPGDPPASARRPPRQVLRRRHLRYQNPPRGGAPRRPERQTDGRAGSRILQPKIENALR
jgi:hypothetical protein